MSKFEQIIYEPVEAGIVRIILDRPEARNAQDTRMLYELNDALDQYYLYFLKHHKHFHYEIEYFLSYFFQYF